MIDSSYLLGLFGQSYTPAFGGGGLGLGASKRQPTPPWDSRASAPPPSELLRTALSTRQFVNPKAAQLDVAGASEDYRNLFALYQGLTLLNALANRAAAKGVSSFEIDRLNTTFAKGLAEIGDFIAKTDFKGVDLARAQALETARSTGGVQRPANEYRTPPLHYGAADEAVAAFQGDVAFTLKVSGLAGDKSVVIDLAGMGGQTRSISNVVSYINQQLEAAGVQTRFATERIKAPPRTIDVGGKPVNLPTGQDGWALKIAGSSLETLRFEAAQADAVYVLQRPDDGDAAQLLKFQTGAGAPAAIARAGETHWVEDRAFAVDLPGQIKASRAMASGPDGSVYVVADVAGTVEGQAVRGERDVALLKYDSAGRLVQVRALGAADSAQGFALAVSADGKVAVAGSVRGGLTGAGSAPGAQGDLDSFVTVFDADGGELWTKRRAARLEDQATAVAFGADGSVYVGGKAKSAMTGGAPVGGWDGYVQAFTSTGAAGFTRQFGTSGDDAVQAIAVEGDRLIVAGAGGDSAVLRGFDLANNGAEAGVRDLGQIGGGVAAMTLDAGRLYVAGSTRNASLGGVTPAGTHGGGQDGFVLSVDASLSADASDRLFFHGGAGEDAVTGLAVRGGKLWLTGRTDVVQQSRDGSIPASGAGYLMRLDAATGAAEYEREIATRTGVSAPLGLAFSAGGASVLDRLGLPQGTIDYTPSQKLVDATALRAGDQFVIRSGVSRRSVTIEANETLASLARKIQIASNGRLSAGTYREEGRERLKVEAREGRDAVEILAGPAGKDALRALGLSEALIKDADPDGPKTFGLMLASDLSLATPDAAKRAGAALQDAMTQVRAAYRSLNLPTGPGAITGQAPAYLTNQLANYQAALSRLTGGF
ncbi:transcriptional regulator [Brevundimonas sp. 2R-24]|uniref:Transcriptional regulator n=1 Tax=Peiella sedimenti TaxID=3061083 RepID=A0ABT8SNE4_9CAUL|nr:transcriptional regulator [Caulobacteraceae bacterium XZ-24]